MGVGGAPQLRQRIDCANAATEQRLVIVHSCLNTTTGSIQDARAAGIAQAAAATTISSAITEANATGSSGWISNNKPSIKRVSAIAAARPIVMGRCEFRGTTA